MREALSEALGRPMSALEACPHPHPCPGLLSWLSRWACPCLTASHFADRTIPPNPGDPSLPTDVWPFWPGSAPVSLVQRSRPVADSADPFGCPPTGLQQSRARPLRLARWRVATLFFCHPKRSANTRQTFTSGVFFSDWFIFDASVLRHHLPSPPNRVIMRHVKRKVPLILRHLLTGWGQAGRRGGNQPPSGSVLARLILKAFGPLPPTLLLPRPQCMLTLG